MKYSIIIILTALAVGYGFVCYQTWNADRGLQQKVREQSEQVQQLQERLQRFQQNVEILDEAVKKTKFEER